MLNLRAAPGAFRECRLTQAVNGTIVGNVADSLGGAIPNAKVTLTEVNTKIVHTGLTSQPGAYEFPEMAPGAYFGYSASLPWDRAEANIDMVNTWTNLRSSPITNSSGE